MARIIRDDADKFFEYGLNIPTRTIFMGSVASDWTDAEQGVDFQMADRIIKALHLLDTAATNGEKPIFILMNNPGGDEYHGMAIYDAIKACKNHITITVFGHAMSMGSVILQAADERIMAPNSKMMIHHGTMSMDGHAKNFESWADEVKRLRIQMVEIYLEKMILIDSKITSKKIDAMCDFDKFFTAQEAVDIGLADKVLT